MLTSFFKLIDTRSSKLEHDKWKWEMVREYQNIIGYQNKKGASPASSPSFDCMAFYRKEGKYKFEGNEGENHLI